MSELVDGPGFDEVANYPSKCCARFLVLTGKCQTASLGVKRHFIYPECDEVLDSYLLWCSIYSE